MSKGFTNIPVVALGACISLGPRVNTEASMQGVFPPVYLHALCSSRFNNLILEPVCLGFFDRTMAARANMEAGTDAILASEFNERAERWERETAIHSSPGATYLHKDYIAIISKGVANKKTVVPLILKRIPNSGADWFFALENIAEENPAKDAINFDDALHAWCAWAKAQGFIKETNEVLAA